MCSLKDNGIDRMYLSKMEKQDSINLEELCELIKITKKCKSLMLVGLMYWYVKILDYQLDSNNCDFQMPNEYKSQLQSMNTPKKTK